MNVAEHRFGRIVACVAALGLALGAGACGPDDAREPQDDPVEQASEPIVVVASVNQWGSLAEQIGGEDVQVTSIVNTTAVDAHDFEPQTADVAALQQAEVVVSNGAGYDAWATANLTGDAASVSAAETVGAMTGDNPHLWFSKDARNGMATELAEAFSKARPDKREEFESRLAAWKEQEAEVEQAMDDFSAAHPDATYAATEAVAYYLMSDLGFEDLTPQGYAQAAANESEPAPADLQEFQELLESRGVDMLVNNTQQAGDTTNMITGTAGRAEVPVLDVSEQMPEDCADLTAWIASLVKSIDALFATDETEEGDTADDATTGDGDGAAAEDGTTAPSNEGQSDPAA